MINDEIDVCAEFGSTPTGDKYLLIVNPVEAFPVIIDFYKENEQPYYIMIPIRIQVEDQRVELDPIPYVSSTYEYLTHMCEQLRFIDESSNTSELVNSPLLLCKVAEKFKENDNGFHSSFNNDDSNILQEEGNDSPSSEGISGSGEAETTDRLQ